MIGLQARDAVVVRCGSPEQDANGIGMAPGGDPDGNILSISQHLAH